MNQIEESSSGLPQPLRAIGSGLRRLPGTEQVSKVTDSALDWIGVISPRGRRVAVYAGAGVLGFAGVVEWPVALTGAAVAWLTQPHPRQSEHPPSDLAKDGMRSAAADTGTTPRETTDPESYGAGDRLEPSHFHQDRPADHPHEQPAKVGDPTTASALKQVARASSHHAAPHSAQDAPKSPPDTGV
ncbi:hypothetical protein GCM10010300_07830 [Streptomyces olivaceoviridis]|uniref:hypothetical protein n=1 Tax=Streptomyces olivaceoviridis TaxID=1921 RepID=UPI001675D32C|nr:hypothetical protein [Streptomyces olivaceoviridis]GGY67375.1 hypothetical protein GCM10010300_07830 [Streptomyces olivaceoviridis]